MINLKYHSRTALGYFMLAAVLGVILRSFHSVEIPVNYRFIVHTHSHIALLGWVYMALTTLIYKLYLQKQGLDKKYRVLFWFTQTTLVGMLLSFPFQGYALFSIVFSTLFLFTSYWFTWFFVKNTPSILKHTHSFKCIKMALWYMVLSSVGPWALGAIMTTLGAESIWYRLAIYFYLHFQYNGWMILGLIGLFFYAMEQQKVILPRRVFKFVFWQLNLGIIFTFFLSVLWTEPDTLFYVLGGVGGVLQISAITRIVIEFTIHKEYRKGLFSSFQKLLLKIILGVFWCKMGLQLITSIPYFANLAERIPDFTIGYLHWTFLGFVSISLFLFLDYFNLIKISSRAFAIYLIGFFATESFIFYKGFSQWFAFSVFDGYFTILAIISLLIPISLVYLLIFNIKQKNSS